LFLTHCITPSVNSVIIQRGLCQQPKRQKQSNILFILSIHVNVLNQIVFINRQDEQEKTIQDSRLRRNDGLVREHMVFKLIVFSYISLPGLFNGLKT